MVAKDPGMPTLAVIARHAGVSVPTVSRVINGREDVAAGTRARVSAVLEKLGYVQRGTVRIEPRNAPKLVDVVFHSLRSTYASELLRSIEERAHIRGLDIVVSAVERRNPNEHPVHGWLDKVADRGTAGALLVLVRLTAAQRAWLQHFQVPFVLIDPITIPAPGVAYVTATNRAGGYAAGEYLAKLGHERIAIITGKMGKVPSRDRLSGFRAALDTAGLPLRQDYVETGHFMVPEARQAMHRLLDLAEPPTAVFCCSDQMAVGAYDALRERGIAVPTRMSMVGFDDTAECALLDPPLTTIRQPLAQMAAVAFDLLADAITLPQAATARSELATTLVVRGSTAPPTGP